MILSLRWQLACCLMVLTTASPFLAAAEPMRYVYPSPHGEADVRLNYYWEMLQAALEETTPKWGPYVMAQSARAMSGTRSEIQLSNSIEINVIVRTTTLQRERSFHAIRIPLDKGLTGYRLFLIKASNQPKLDAVRTLTQLQAFTIGQVAEWVDTDILRGEGFSVVTSSSYESLLPMLASSRYELLARGVNEVGPEFAAGSKTIPDLAIEHRLLLYYPLPRYFFFARNPEGERLAERVEEGLRILIRNGKFERRYQVFKKFVLRDLKLAGRRVFRLNNPYLSPETPLTNRELWDTLEAELASAPDAR